MFCSNAASYRLPSLGSFPSLRVHASRLAAANLPQNVDNIPQNPQLAGNQPSHGGKMAGKCRETPGKMPGNRRADGGKQPGKMPGNRTTLHPFRPSSPSSPSSPSLHLRQSLSSLQKPDPSDANLQPQRFTCDAHVMQTRSAADADPKRPAAIPDATPDLPSPNRCGWVRSGLPGMEKPVSFRLIDFCRRPKWVHGQNDFTGSHSNP